FLMELYKQDGLTQSELHKSIGIEQPTAVRTLDRMERDGLISRAKSPSDRRILFINLTDKGKQYKTILLNCACELNRFALKGFTENEHKLLNDLLQRLNSNLGS
ncbi:MAG: MarR family transcriptional regulator, partial [bacterium]|nr:MarR family transcriptional regulator [bacterium]